MADEKSSQPDVARDSLLSVGKDNYLSIQIKEIERKQNRQHLIYLVVFFCFAAFAVVLSFKAVDRLENLYGSISSLINNSTRRTTGTLKKSIREKHLTDLEKAGAVLEKLNASCDRAEEIMARLEKDASLLQRQITQSDQLLEKVNKQQSTTLVEVKLVLKELTEVIKQAENVKSVSGSKHVQKRKD